MMLRFCSRGYYSAVSRLLIYLFVYFIDVLRLTQEYFICATAASITVGGNPKVVRSPCVWVMTLRTHLLKKQVQTNAVLDNVPLSLQRWNLECSC